MILCAMFSTAIIINCFVLGLISPAGRALAHLLVDLSHTKAVDSLTFLHFLLVPSSGGLLSTFFTSSVPLLRCFLCEKKSLKRLENKYVCANHSPSIISSSCSGSSRRDPGPPLPPPPPPPSPRRAAGSPRCCSSSWDSRSPWSCRPDRVSWPGGWSRRRRGFQGRCGSLTWLKLVQRPTEEEREKEDF